MPFELLHCGPILRVVKATSIDFPPAQRLRPPASWQSNDMFFDDAYMAALLKKHASKLASHRPGHFALATDPKRERQRAWANRTLENLEPRGAETLFRNIQTLGRFLQSYNELAVAAILQTAGLKLAYEPEIDGKTPDLVALDTGDRPTHIIEVLNRRRPKPVDAADRRWDELTDRFARIHEPWRLRVARISGDRTGPYPDVAIHLVRETARWLASNPIAVGQGWAIGDYTFLVVARSPGTDLELLTPVEEVWVDSDALADEIREKVSRYAGLAGELNVPMVVVVGADDNLAVTSEVVRSALNGQLSVSVNLNLFGVGSGSSTSAPLKLHATDAPRVWNRALSAVGWLKAGVDEPGVVTLFSYDKAARNHGIVSSKEVILG